MPSEAENLASAAAFPLGGLIAYLAVDVIEIAIVLPFAAGSFLYAAASDLMSQLRSPSLRGQLVQFSAFMLGLLLLLAATWI